MYIYVHACMYKSNFYGQSIKHTFICVSLERDYA